MKQIMLRSDFLCVMECPQSGGSTALRKIGIFLLEMNM